MNPIFLSQRVCDLLNQNKVTWLGNMGKRERTIEEIVEVN